MITEESERSDECGLFRRHDVINEDTKFRSSLIPVIYFDNSPGMVKPEELNELIQKRMIISFRRSSGWVRICGDPIRGKGGRYGGPDRRKG